jgi:hypothetical protein
VKREVIRRNPEELIPEQRKEFDRMRSLNYDIRTAWNIATKGFNPPVKQKAPPGRAVARLNGYEPPSPEVVEEFRTGLISRGVPVLLANNIAALAAQAVHGWAYCPQHGCKLEVEMPDLGAQLKLLEKVLPYYSAKIPEQRNVAVAVGSLDDLRSLSDEQLAAIIAAEN